MPPTQADDFIVAVDQGEFEQSLASKPLLFVVGRDKKQFHVHQKIIAQLSPQLATLSGAHTSETGQETIDWSDVDLNTFVRLARFAYVGDYTEAEPQLLPYDSYQDDGSDDDGTEVGEDVDEAGAGTKSTNTRMAAPPTPPPNNEPTMHEGHDEDEYDDSGDSEAGETGDDGVNGATKTSRDENAPSKSFRSFNFASSLYKYMRSNARASRDVTSSHHDTTENNAPDRGEDSDRPSDQQKKRRRISGIVKPRYDAKYETIRRFAHLSTPSMRPWSQSDAGEDGLNIQHGSNQLSRLRQWQPRKNIGPSESYERVFLSHANLYFLADKYGVQPLRALTLYRLHKSLLHFTIYQERIVDLVKLAETVYENSSADDEARAILAGFFGCIVENIRGCEEFQDLLKEAPDFAQDVMLQMMERRAED